MAQPTFQVCGTNLIQIATLGFPTISETPFLKLIGIIAFLLFPEWLRTI